MSVGIREGAIPLSKIVASKLLPCPKCGSLMWLASDQRTFECEDCGHQVTRIFKWRSSPQSANLGVENYPIRAHSERPTNWRTQ